MTYPRLERTPILRVLLPILVIIPLLVACGDGSAPAATPLPDPLALLEKAATDIQQVKSLKFKLQLQGAPAFIDDAKRISFVSADGAYLAPKTVGAKVSAAELSIPGQIDIVAVGDDQYYKHVVLTANKWLKQPFAPGFNADNLIRSEDGIKKALKSLREVKMEGTEDRFGTPVYHITGKAATTDISALTVGLIRGTGDALVDVYIAVETNRVDSLRLVQPETVTEQYTEPTTWTMDLFDYDDSTIKIDVPTEAIEPAPGNGGLVPGAIPPGSGTAEPTAEATQQP